ncbi:hypothetical protein AAC978_15640 [Desulfitobacterium sp. THU1]|uniref:DUF7336 domain-containing protein n=1 Tax=Desulfitobacterium sp. THU1 TaxID=3138072 RepID=UPI00311F7B4E
MTSVFLLQHCYEVNNIEEIKIIGIYSSRSKAELVVEKYKGLLGFRNYPNSFFIDEYRLDEDNWTEGFIGIN